MSRRNAHPLDTGRTYLLLAEVFAATGEDVRALELYELAVERLERHRRPDT